MKILRKSRHLSVHPLKCRPRGFVQAHSNEAWGWVGRKFRTGLMNAGIHRFRSRQDTLVNPLFFFFKKSLTVERVYPAQMSTRGDNGTGTSGAHP